MLLKRILYRRQITKTRRQLKLILETLPRSGTHWTMRWICKQTGLNFASVFDSLPPNEPRMSNGKFTPTPISHKALTLYFSENTNSRGYIVFSHYSQPVPLWLSGDEIPRIRQICYPYDFVRSLAWANGGKIDSKEEFYLSYDNKHWKEIKSLYFKNLDWFFDHSYESYIRLEDYHNDCNSVISRINEITQQELQLVIPEVRINKDRLYFIDNYEKYMDQRIFEEITDFFNPVLERFYPEKQKIFKL